MIVHAYIDRVLEQWTPAVLDESVWSFRTVCKLVYALLGMLYSNLVVRPLAILYFFGPQWHGFGMWAGADPHDICAKITNVPSTHWASHMDDCLDLLTRDFYSYLLLLQFLVACLVLYKMLQWCWYNLNEPIQTRQYLRILERQHQLETEKLVRLLEAKQGLPSTHPTT